jgi:hypothetical protein
MLYKIKISEISEFLLIAFMLYYYLLPSAYNKVSPWLVLGIIIAYSLCILIQSNKKVQAQITLILLLILFISFLYISLTKSESGLSIVERLISKFNQWVKMFFPLLLYYRFIKNENKVLKSFLLIFSAVIIAFVVYNSFLELANNPHAARLWSNFDEVKNRNAITYEYVYAISALIPLLFFCMLRVEKYITKIILIVPILILFNLLIAAQYTLSILLAIICCMICVCVNYRNIYFLILSVLAGIVMAVTLPYLFTWLSTTFESKTISIRFYEMAQLLKGNDISSNGDLADRISIYKNCFIYFFRSPIWGNMQVPFNTHSTFLGVLCDLGIIGTVPVYYLSFSMRKRVNTIDMNESVKTGFAPVYAAWVLLGFLNPIHAALPLNMVVWFLAPALLHILKERFMTSDIK